MYCHFFQPARRQAADPEWLALSPGPRTHPATVLGHRRGQASLLQTVWRFCFWVSLLCQNTFKDTDRKITAICTSALRIHDERPRQQKVQESLFIVKHTVPRSLIFNEGDETSLAPAPLPRLQSWGCWLLGQLHFQSVPRSKGRTRALAQCPDAPSALLLPWGDPRGCFTYSSTVSCLVFFPPLLYKAIFVPLKHDTQEL